MTNFEKIKNMSVEELANFIQSKIGHCFMSMCKKCPFSNNDCLFKCCYCDIVNYLNREEHEEH